MSEVIINPYRFAGGGTPDGLGSDADCVMTGSVNFQEAGKVDTYSLEFAGGKGTISLSSSLNLSSALTISLWAKNSSWAGAGSTSQILLGDVGGGQIHLTFMDVNNKKIKTEGGLGTMFSGTLALDTWYNIVIRNDGSDSSLWIDGVEADTATGSVTTFTNWYFGIDGVNYPWDGFIDSFGLWSRKITDAEVATLYNSGSGNPVDTIDTTGLRIWYNWEQASSPITNQAIP